ncbi:unnamed protein product [Ixodes pacificus]
MPINANVGNVGCIGKHSISHQCISQNYPTKNNCPFNASATLDNTNGNAQNKHTRQKEASQDPHTNNQKQHPQMQKPQQRMAVDTGTRHFDQHRHTSKQSCRNSLKKRVFLVEAETEL